MKCPRCGAENAEQAEFCYLCEHPFAEGSEAGADVTQGASHGIPPSQAGAPGSSAPPPPPAAPQHAAPPPPYQGKQLLSPGATPPAFGTAPAKKGLAYKTIAMATVAVLVVIAAGLVAFFLTRGRTYTIKVPTPPGYSKADDEMIEEAKKSFKGDAKSITIDALFVDEANTNFVFVLHQDVPFSDAPSGKDPEEMERYFYEHKDEWTEAFASGILEAGSDLNPQLEKYEVIRLASGDAALHMTTSLDIQQYSFLVETMWIIKESSAFAIVIEGLDPDGSEVVEFLRQNISFE